ncbi:Tic 20-v protein [Thalictrum thalictroides]|uniref:Protein TIC 20 n=1 Tax=Thalictrum thalictroides TaxID=46969 RepID=A0A7J6X3R0_THATH|nr:Tic 20-v protein [Thalictrum thalictroides]
MASTPLLRFSLRPSQETLRKPFLSQTPIHLKSTVKISRSPSKTICMAYQTVPATDRLVSSFAYFLPFFNGLQYGRYLLMKYPNLALVLEPIFPLLNIYRSVPYASFVCFFALYLGVVKNPSFSKYVRFNSMQAVVLDVLLSLPLLFQRVFSPGKGLGLKLLVMGYNSIFVFIVFSFLYSLGHCVLGRTPYLPLVAEAADRQL